MIQETYMVFKKGNLYKDSILLHIIQLCKIVPIIWQNKSLVMKRLSFHTYLFLYLKKDNYEILFYKLRS